MPVVLVVGVEEREVDAVELTGRGESRNDGARRLRSFPDATDSTMQLARSTGPTGTEPFTAVLYPGNNTPERATCAGASRHGTSGQDTTSLQGAATRSVATPVRCSPDGMQPWVGDSTTVEQLQLIDFAGRRYEHETIGHSNDVAAARQAGIRTGWRRHSRSTTPHNLCRMSDRPSGRPDRRDAQRGPGSPLRPPHAQRLCHGGNRVVERSTWHPPDTRRKDIEAALRRNRRSVCTDSPRSPVRWHRVRQASLTRTSTELSSSALARRGWARAM